MSLTNTVIRNVKPGEKTRKMFDGRGLYLEVTSTGSKWWRLKYRFDSKEKRISLGTYPDVSLKDARERCNEARRLLANGIDPSEQRKAENAAKAEHSKNSFEAIAREWFSKHAPNWSDSHSVRVISRLERDIFPWIGDRAVSKITAPLLLDTIRRVEDRGALVTAHRLIGICSQVFRYAIASGRAEYNPSSDLRGALTPVKVKHLASVTQPKKVGEILRALDGYEGTLPVRCALRLAPLVFVRPGELRHAQWKDIDLENEEWRFMVTKTETQHIVPPTDPNCLPTLRSKPLYAPNGTNFCERLVESLPGIRNMGAHGEAGLGFPTTALDILEICACIANALFRDPGDCVVSQPARPVA